MAREIYRMERDRARFKDVVRGRIRRDLRRYLSSSELVASRATRSSRSRSLHRAPAFPLRELGGRRGPGIWRRGRAGEGQAGEEGNGREAGEQAGEHVLEAEVELEELAAMLGESSSSR